MEFDALEWVALLVLGVIAGTINTMVGGGTSIILPLLYFMGLPLQIANGTNRLAVSFQACAAVGTLRRRGVGSWRDTLPPALMALLGGIPGAYLAAVMDPQRFRVAAGWVLLVGIVFFFLRPPKPGEEPPRRTPVLGWIGAFAMGVYGGFLGAGVGVLILIFLTPLLRLPLVSMVAVKVLMVFMLSVSASVVFVLEGQVRWDYAGPLIVANIVGGIIGARLTVRGGEKWVRPLVAVVAAILAVLLILGIRVQD